MQECRSAGVRIAEEENREQTSRSRSAHLSLQGIGMRHVWSFPHTQTLLPQRVHDDAERLCPCSLA